MTYFEFEFSPLNSDYILELSTGLGSLYYSDQESEIWLGLSKLLLSYFDFCLGRSKVTALDIDN